MAFVLDFKMRVALLLLLPALGDAFLGRYHARFASPTSSPLQATGQKFEITVDLPPSDSGVTAIMKFESILSVPSEVVQVRYKIPFGLDVSPRKNLAVCTKDGPGGEMIGDVLRYASQWKLGFPQGGEALTDSISSISGGVSWQCSMFNVMEAKKWEQVVEALVSNTDTRTDEVVLVFERPEGGKAPETEP